MQDSSLAKIPQADLKLELDDPATREEIKKATMQLKVGKPYGIMASQQKSISTGVKRSSISSRICSQTVGRKGLHRRTSEMQSLSLCTKRRENNQTGQPTEASPLSLIHI